MCRYEYFSRDSWLMKDNRSHRVSRPSMEIFMLKIFMSLVVGVTCALWIWSGRTVTTWKKLGKRLLQKRKNEQPPATFIHQPLHLKKQHLLLLDHKQKCNSKSKHGTGCKSGSETAV